MAVFQRRRHRKTTVARVNGHIESVASIAPPHGAGPWLIPRDPADATIAAAAAQLPLSLSAAGYHASTARSCGIGVETTSTPGPAKPAASSCGAQTPTVARSVATSLGMLSATSPSETTETPR